MQIFGGRWSKPKFLKWAWLCGLVAIATLLLSQILHPTASGSPLAGGQTTVLNRSSTAYEQPAANLTATDLEEHFAGDLAFDAVFVTPPARVNAGLGPHFNNSSCVGCHIRNGRGLPEKGQLLVRVSRPENQKTDQNLSPEPASLNSYHAEDYIAIENTPPVAGLGTQIQDQAVYGQPPEAQVEINWQEHQGKYPDGTPYQLRSPQALITLSKGQPLPPQIKTSLRIPPPVFGLGLLEAIPDATLQSLADPEDQNHDGVSGRPNRVWDGQKQAEVIGRFGLKANQPNLFQQSAAAYVNDMGVTNPLFPESNSDIDQQTLKAATFYVQSLGVPARTLLDNPEVKKGEHLFTQANCIACHTATLQTGAHPLQALAKQRIHPYSDLLLHDMGPGLADNRPDFLASGTEWRTAPLWGLGLTQTVLPYSSFLHDGRARSIEEAVLWHGGEAQTAQKTFKGMKERDRKALLAFLNSL
ncbi:MAG: c-type cytochrome [Acaryochloridaceae cyanobacterium SU_2_1]|nr:c-type cytochrome [Acaryochloridaceae cyanobacterium SU_2_1]